MKRQRIKVAKTKTDKVLSLYLDICVFLFNYCTTYDHYELMILKKKINVEKKMKKKINSYDILIILLKNLFLWVS